jgi:cell division septation protein DedD
VQRPAPVIAEIASPPSVAAVNPTEAPDQPVTESAPSATPSLAEAGTEAAGNVAPLVEVATATTPAEDSAWGPAISGSDIEVITSPAALLLSSTAASSPDGGDSTFENDVAGMGMDPELAMEIATAPAVTSDMDAEPVTVTSMAIQETGADTTPSSTGSGSTMPGATQPARNMINRGTASLAATDSGIPKTDIKTAGFATSAEMTPAAESTTAQTDPAVLAASQPETTTAHEDGAEIMAATAMEALDNLPPTAAGPAVTVAEIPADSDLQAQDKSAATGKDSLARETTVVALTEPEPAAVAPSPAAAAAAAPTGGWVVNLASYTYESTARKKLEEFQAKGVTGEIERIMVNDKPLYRIRVTGFESSRSARASIPAIQEALGLKGAWIARR